MICSKRRYMTGAVAVMITVACISETVAAQSQEAAQQAATQTSVEVRGAQQSNYTRLAIALPSDVSYETSHLGRLFTLRIDSPVVLNVSQLLTSPLRQATNPNVTYRPNQTVLELDVPSDASIRDFRSGQYLVIDFYSDNAARAQVAQNTVQGASPDQSGEDASRIEQPAPDGSSGGQADTADTAEGEDSSADEVDPQSGPEETVQSSSVANSDDAPPLSSAYDADQDAAVLADGQSPGPSESQPDSDETSGAGQADTGGSTSSSGVTDVEITRDPRPQGPVAITGESSADNAATVEVVDLPDNAGMQMRMPWQEGVAAAAFERAGFLWVVFDQPVGFNADGLRAADEIVRKRVKNVDVLPNQDALVLRMGLYPNQNVVVEKDRNDWLIALKDTPAKPRFPLVPEHQADGGQGQQIYIPATDLGRKIELEDPAVGDMLVVLPTRLEGRGLVQKYTYASSEVLETAQGIVINPLSDFVNVERFTDGVAIRSGGNNILSASKLSRETGIGQSGSNGTFHRLIDFKAWRIGNDWEYRKNKSRLFYELSLQPADDRNEVRWKLARYYLAHGRGSEAIGVLTRMLDEDPLLTENTEYLAVRGVANFKAGRLTQAAADLSARGLEAEQDAELWRVLVAESRGNYDDALEHYRRGKDVMGTYDDSDRAEIQLAVVRSALSVGNLEQAQRELDLLNGLELSEEQLSESIYQGARIAEQQGQMDIALAQYDDLTDVPQRWIAARARYSRAKYNLRVGDITPAQAIDELERLRYAWRGDRFEIELLDDLADLYFQTGQYESGLTSLRLGMTHYPRLAEERRMQTRSGQIFRQLYLEGGADRMTPVSAISLYYKFRELTPLGTDGDLMIRRLSERLVSVDLLGRAAELLEYQVRVRTEGAARAQIAANLAKIYILDDRSDEALQILRATREPRLPADIEASRRHVEARALTELGRYEEAEVVLDGDKSVQADYLRADIFWGAKNWSSLTSTVRRLLSDGWRRNETLTDRQRLNLIRLTIAMTFDEDRAGLIETRRRYGRQMRQGDFANAFDLLTNDQELSGRELGAIASQIASVEKLQSFMRDYRSDFSGR